MNGQVMGEKRNGAERDYIPDALGNTVGLTDNTEVRSRTLSKCKSILHSDLPETKELLN